MPAFTSGLSLDMQDPGDVNFISTFVTPGFEATTGLYYIESPVGGNNYLQLIDSGCTGGRRVLINKVAVPMTYSAITILPGGTLTGMSVIFYDAFGTAMDRFEVYPVPFAARYEVKIVGTSPSLYINGQYQGTLAALPQNPSYIGWSGTSGACGGHDMLITDIVWEDSANKYLFGQPTLDQYIVVKDLLSPAASGFYFVNGTLINSAYMPVRYSKDTNATEQVDLVGYSTGVPWSYHYTYANMTESFSWNISSALITSGAPYGLYATTITGHGYSVPIQFVGNGATVSWDQSLYSINDPATISYTISPTYFITGTYSYALKIIDIYGEVHVSQPIASAVGSYNFTFNPTDYDPGYIFAEVVATPIAGGSDIPLKYATAEIINYAVIRGYVMDASIGTVLPNASIAIYQASTIINITASFDGNYSTSVPNVYANYPIWINSSKSGYTNDSHTWTPLIAKTYNVNISLIPINPSTDYVTLGGIVYEMPYYTPMENTFVSVINATLGYSCTNTTNIAGYYRCGKLNNATYNNVWASKSGYTNSTVYSKFVSGV